MSFPPISRTSLFPSGQRALEGSPLHQHRPEHSRRRQPSSRLGCSMLVDEPPHTHMVNIRNWLASLRLECLILTCRITTERTFTMHPLHKLAGTSKRQEPADHRLAIGLCSEIHFPQRELCAASIRKSQSHDPRLLSAWEN